MGESGHADPWAGGDEHKAEFPGQDLVEAGHRADSVFATTEGANGILEGVSEEGSIFSAVGHSMHGLAPFMTALGGGLGAFNAGMGFGRIVNAAKHGDPTGSEGSQGVLDVASGGAGMAGLLARIATGSVGAPLALASGLLGLAASGNEYAEEHGYYGKRFNEKSGKLENSTYLNSIGDDAHTGWDAGKNLAGKDHPILGDVFGAIGAGVGGTTSAIWNTGAAAYGGLRSGAEWFNKTWDATHPWAGREVPGVRFNAANLAASDIRLKHGITRICEPFQLLATL